MSDTLYVGVLVHEHGQDTVISGYDYASVVETTKLAYITHLDEVWGISADEAKDYPLTHTHDIVVTATIPLAPKSEPEPKWFTEAKDILSPLELAEWVFSENSYEFRKDCLIERLAESFENHEDYEMALITGWVKGFELSDESLSKLATNTGRSVEEYKQDYTLAIVDYLRWETQER